MSSGTSSPAGSDTESDTASSYSVSEPARQALLNKYQTLLSSTLDLDDLKYRGFLPTQPIDSGKKPEAEDERHEDERGMTKAEKQNAKKKRRREREREAKAMAEGSAANVGCARVAEVNHGNPRVAFRLFSSCPLASVKLAEEDETYPVPLNPRHRPLSQEAITTRHHQAQSSAVEWPNLGGPSAPADRWTRASNPIRTITTQGQSSPLDKDTRILLVDIPRQGQTFVSGSRRELSRTKVDEYTIPHVACQDDLKPPKKRIRRCRSSRRNAKGQGQIGVKDKPRQVAGYYHPPDHLGGKSMSTLWGYGLGMSR